MTAKNLGEVHGGGRVDPPGEKTATAIVADFGVIHDGSGRTYQPGETIELSQSEIKRLIALGALEDPAGKPGHYYNGKWVHSTLRK